MFSKSERCQELSSPSITNFVVSCILLVGILVSYLPQHLRIIQRRSSEGLSPYFVLLGTTSGTCAFANILTLPTSREDLACCAVNSRFSCAAGLLGIAQIGVQWSCFLVITLLFLSFVPRYGIDHRDGHEVPLEPTNIGLGEAVGVVIACVIHFAAIFIISVVFLARYPNKIGIWADLLGLQCALLASIQYIPQIWTTWRLQHIGSLSIPMMCIQTPGSFLFAFSLAVRFGKSGWSAWSVYIVTGILQGCLLVMAILFELRERRENKSVAFGVFPNESSDRVGGADVQFDNEGAPLLGDQAGSQRYPRYTDPANHPLAPHRLNPDPDSDGDSVTTAIQASPAVSPSGTCTRTERWENSAGRLSSERNSPSHGSSSV